MRYNLNSVVRPNTAHVLAPTLVKQVVKKEKPNFVKLNKRGLGEVSSINKKRAEQMSQNLEKMRRNNTMQSFCRKSEQTRSSTDPSVILNSPESKTNSSRHLQTQQPSSRNKHLLTGGRTRQVRKRGNLFSKEAESSRKTLYNEFSQNMDLL